MQGINKTVAVGGALLLAVAAYAYGWHRGDSGQQPDLATDVSAVEDGRKTYYPNTETLGANEMRVISLGRRPTTNAKTSATSTRSRCRRSSEGPGTVPSSSQSAAPSITCNSQNVRIPAKNAGNFLFLDTGNTPVDV